MIWELQHDHTYVIPKSILEGDVLYLDILCCIRGGIFKYVQIHRSL